jgi:hypothetical protein
LAEKLLRAPRLQGRLHSGAAFARSKKPNEVW